MYSRTKIRCPCISGVLCRFLSSAEVSTALRPFYFSVHPDLFGKYPEQRRVNENSLQQLSALIEAQQSSRRLAVPPLPFYLRQKDMPDGQFKLVQIRLNGANVRDTVIKVLSACDMPTNYVDKIPHMEPKRDFRVEFHKAYQEYSDGFERATRMKRDVEQKKAALNVIEWINGNSEDAKTKYQTTSPTREQVNSLIDGLCKTYGIKQVKYDNGWNISHIRGALQSLAALASQHPQVMANLEGRTIALGQFTGVSLDGDVFLNIIDVRNEWLSLIKKVNQQDGALLMIPNYEKALSSILRNIHVSRRKFMPKVSAIQYCQHLRQLITSIGDFYGRGNKFPSTVPDSLDKYEIVVEPEAGPLMVSPTGQFITPSSCPADDLIKFIGSHLDEATELMTEYSINKHIEKALHEEVVKRFGLLELHKDDSITPALMISCCQRLLTKSDQINMLVTFRVREKLTKLSNDPNNYRPISVTSILCKTMERVLNRRLMAYLEDNNLLSDRQYGFRRNRSTGDLLVYATHILSEAIERYGEALAVSLDISKAFDRVWHESLINKLPSYGLPPALCTWIEDFLRERSIRVVVDGCSSEQMAINAGVPQGY